MLRHLGRSRITINHHIDVAENYANNLRLYEATGMGALLVTDAKSNLGDIFDNGREVAAYRSPEQAVEMVQYYLDHDEERRAVARRGQQRVLTEHTYAHRMKEFVTIVEKYV